VLPAVAEIMAIQTRRSRLPASRATDPLAWKRGFDYLARTYRPAMVQYVGALVRRNSRHVADREVAEEIVQSWFLSSMEKDWLVPKGGPIRSFRAFLKDSLRKFTSGELDRRFAKRRTVARTTSLDAQDEPASDRNNPAASILDRSLMDVAFQAAMRRLREVSKGHAAVIELLLASDGDGVPGVAALLGRKGTRDRDAARRAQARLATLFREELEKTVQDTDELELFLRLVDRYLP